VRIDGAPRQPLPKKRKKSGMPTQMFFAVPARYSTRAHYSFTYFRLIHTKVADPKICCIAAHSKDLV
jgi:hypothetical protein